MILCIFRSTLSNLAHNEKMTVGWIIKNEMEYPSRELRKHHSHQRCNENNSTINDKPPCFVLCARVGSRNSRIIIGIRRGGSDEWDIRTVRRRTGVYYVSSHSSRVEFICDRCWTRVGYVSSCGRRWSGAGFVSSYCSRVEFVCGKRWTGRGRRIGIACWCAGGSSVSVSISVSIIITISVSISITVSITITSRGSITLRIPVSIK
jgi:hypothetical protein